MRPGSTIRASSGELADAGVYAGMVSIRAMIARSAAHDALMSGASRSR